MQRFFVSRLNLKFAPHFPRQFLIQDWYQAKIAGRSWRKTKNAPAIANVRAQGVTRKKNFMKI
jgi:hypothetical protein